MEPISSVLIPAITETVFGVLAEATGLSDWLRQRLGRDPEKLAFQHALTQALTDSAEKFPGRDLRYFAEILRNIGGPLLACTLQPAADLPTAEELTTVWLNHLTIDSLIHYRAEFTTFAGHFLERLAFHLENQQPLQWIAQARRQRSSEAAMRRMADAAAESVTSIELLHQEVARLTATLATVVQTGSGSTVTTGGGAYNAGNVSAQNFAGRDLTINQYFVQGLAQLVFNYSARIENFLFEYLGGQGQRVPFGGRQAQIDQLNTWLDGPGTPPYLLMVAEAGGGKSALVTRWCAQLATRTDLDVIFMPISIRFQTAAQDVAFAALAARLAQVYDRQATLPAALSAEQWKGKCETYLRLPVPAGKRLLIVIDGLDEATGWEAGPELFAKRPPAGLNILVTARVRAKEVDADQWGVRLGWQDDQIVRKLRLPRLDRLGIADALASMGNPLDHLASQVDLVGELYRLSQGDPLVVRLYVEALQEMGTPVVRIRPEDLTNIEPGLDGFMERWWADQRKQWQMQGKDPFAEEERLLPLLQACTVANGPLLLKDLAELDKQHFGKGMLVTHMAELLGRWVIGDGKKQGYIFSHPRLRNYFGDHMTLDEEREWQVKFCNWGERVLHTLNAGEVDPKHVSEYLLRYYSIHLEHSQASAAAFYALISNGWRLAWEELDVSYAGFLNNVNQVWTQAVESYKQTKQDRATALSQQIKAALCRSSIATMGSNMPSELLCAAVEYNVRTPTQALMIVKLTIDKTQQAQTLISLAPYLPQQLMQEALSLAQGIDNRVLRLEVLSAFLPYLCGHEKNKTLEEIQEDIRSISDHAFRVKVLTRIMPYLSLRDKYGAAKKALTDSKLILDEAARGYALAILAPHLPPELTVNALDIARSIRRAYIRTCALNDIAAYLPNQQEVIWAALTAARELSYGTQYVSALIRLFPNLPDYKQSEVLKEIQISIGWISNKTSSAAIKLELTKRLPEQQRELILQELLVSLKMIDDAHLIASILIEAKLLFPEEIRNTVFIDALVHMRTACDRKTYISVLAKLLPNLSYNQAQDAIRDTLLLCQEIGYKAWSLEVLVSIGKNLSEELLEQVLNEVRNIADNLYRISVLNDLMQHLPEIKKRKVLAHILDAILAVEDEGEKIFAISTLIPNISEELSKDVIAVVLTLPISQDRVMMLLELAVLLPESKRQRTLNEAFNTALAVEDEEQRIEQLIELALLLPKNERDQAINEAFNIALYMDDEEQRVEQLVFLVPLLGDNQWPKALNEAFNTALKIGDEGQRIGKLTYLAPLLSESEQRRALSAAFNTALKIKYNEQRVEQLVKLVPLLPEIEQQQAIGVAFNTALKIKYNEQRVEQLVKLAPLLPETERQQAIEVAFNTALKIEYNEQSVEQLIKLAPLLPETERQRALEVAFNTVMRIVCLEERARALSALKSYLTRNDWERAINETFEDFLAIIGEEEQVDVLIALAPLLPEELLERVIQEDILINEERSTAVSAIAPYLSRKLLNSLFKSIVTLQDTQNLAVTLSALAPHLSEDLLDKAFDVAIATSNNQDRIDILESFVPYIPLSMLGKALQAAFTIKDISVHASASAVLTSYISKFNTEQLEQSYDELVSILFILANQPRSELIDALGILMPFILALAGDEAPQAAKGIYHAIQEVCEWWP